MTIQVEIRQHITPPFEQNRCEKGNISTSCLGKGKASPSDSSVTFSPSSSVDVALLVVPSPCRTRILGGRKQVRFNENPVSCVVRVDNLDDLTAEQTNALYITPKEMEKTCQEVREAISSNMNNSVAATTLDGAFMFAAGLAWQVHWDHEFQTLLRKEKLTGMAEPATKALLTWWQAVDSKQHNSSRGLEKMCSKKQKQRRKQFATSCRSRWLGKEWDDSNSRKNPPAFYNECTRSLALYARIIAHADELAAREIHNEWLTHTP